FQAEDGIRDFHVTGVQTCALPILLGGGTLLSVLVLYAFNFSPDAMLAEAVTVHPYEAELMSPREAVTSNPLNALSLGLALAFGTAGLPHILMRFFTVSSAQ